MKMPVQPVPNSFEGTESGLGPDQQLISVVVYANDLSYNDVFAAQPKPVMTQGDLVIGISGSGNSENVLRAITYASENGGVTLGVCGYDGGKLRQIAQHAICADVNNMQLSE